MRKMGAVNGKKGGKMADLLKKKNENKIMKGGLDP